MSLAFVLGGGREWGAVEVGMLGALADADISPGLIDNVRRTTADHVHALEP